MSSSAAKTTAERAIVIMTLNRAESNSDSLRHVYYVYYVRLNTLPHRELVRRRAAAVRRRAVAAVKTHCKPTGRIKRHTEGANTKGPDVYYAPCCPRGALQCAPKGGAGQLTDPPDRTGGPIFELPEVPK